MAGCGPHQQIHPVSGTVTFQGKPVTAGTIRFCNPQAVVDMTAQLQSDGRYEVLMAKGAGLPEGIYQVAVMPPGVELPPGPMKERPKPKEYPNIPLRYRQPSTSGVTLSVKSGDNRLDLDMQP
jgi:hypothetical protein